ncbi:MAG: 1-deoxy-D-xylulose-5-phosphate reductoisomerase [Kosmotogaceae bacterium]
MIDVCLIGSTGSIGLQTLEVLEDFENHRIKALSCGYNLTLLKQQIKKYKPKYVATLKEDTSPVNEFPDVIFFFGETGIEEMIEVCEADILVNAASGSSGLKYSVRALGNVSRICLANKETIVCGGEFFQHYLKKHNTELIPVDSEHSALFQLLEGDIEPEKIFITASGGSLRDYPPDKMAIASLNEVLKHPTWNMGKRVTIDSATMVNKGLELIEAHYLFGYEEKDILTYINRSSLVHAGVIYADGVIKIHVGENDMKIPISYSLSYPERRKHRIRDLTRYTDLKLERVDYKKYPSLKLARDILGDSVKQIAFNASDEVAVKAFEKNKINFGDIFHVISNTIDSVDMKKPVNFGDIMEIDKMARIRANEEVKKFK